MENFISSVNNCNFPWNCSRVQTLFRIWNVKAAINVTLSGGVRVLKSVGIRRSLTWFSWVLIPFNNDNEASWKISALWNFGESFIEWFIKQELKEEFKEKSTNNIHTLRVIWRTKWIQDTERTNETKESQFSFIYVVVAVASVAVLPTARQWVRCHFFLIKKNIFISII